MNASHAKVERLLAEVVTVKTGGAATAARPGQLQLACDIMDRLDAARTGGPAADTQLAGEAPTGVGKSFALLAAAFIDADDHGRRTVISTQQKVLQNQIVTIDAPDMQQAAANLGMRPVGVEVLKGWASYLCPLKAQEAAEALAGEGSWQDFRPGAGEGPKEITIHGATYGREDALHVLDWALGEHDPDSPAFGDMGGYRPLETKAGKWADPAALVTTAKEDCVGEDCAFWEASCPARKSRERAEAADIIVTNHALLGIQAALGVPSVFGNKLIGTFENVMVDEAHDLSDEVRTRGAQTLTADALRRAAGRILAFTAMAEKANAKASATDMAGLAPAGQTISDLEGAAAALTGTAPVLDEALLHILGQGPGAGPDRSRQPLKAGYVFDQDLEAAAASLLPVLELAVTALSREAGEGDAVVKRSGATEPLRWRAISACTSLITIIGRFTSKDTPRNDAVWVESVEKDGQLKGYGQVAPLNVAGRIRARLWREGTAPRASIAVSATMPENFVRACGMDAAVDCISYESPYAAAYGNTAVFIPSLPAEDIVRLTVPGEENGRASFNHEEHPYWAAEYVGGLIRANRGAALVLAATRRAGEHYAGHLRRMFPGVAVLDQWSTNKEDAIQAWKDDETAVLVGTKSLMTGVDAYGPTNSLVILDKISRSPEDPLLKALVQHLSPSLGWDAAVREVYVVPGANLLKQAGGRLIRRETDGGMFAVLDPRFHKDNAAIPGHYPADVKRVHKRAIRAFGRRIYNYNEALDFLEDQATGRPRLSSLPKQKAA